MRGKVFTLASVALLSCRAVLGIEELEDPTSDGGAGTDGGADAATDSARTDADTGVPPGDGGSGACVSEGGACGRCCRDQAGPAYKDQLEPILKPCLCDGGCTTQCSTNLCAGGDPKDTACLPCMDDAIRNGVCKQERDQCNQTPSCKAVYDCLASCPKP